MTKQEREEFQKLPKAEQEKRILAMQQPSTRLALIQTIAERRAHHKSLFDASKAIAVPDATCPEEAVGLRSFSFEEMAIATKNREARGERLAEMRKEPDAYSVTPKKRSRAVRAFMYIKKNFHELMTGLGIKTEKSTIDRVKEEVFGKDAK
jgi:hypothetical protein